MKIFLPFVLALSAISSNAYSTESRRDALVESFRAVAVVDPEITDIQVCVTDDDGLGEVCEQLDLSVRKGGSRETIQLPKTPSATAGDGGSVADTIGSILGAAGKTVGVGGKVSMEYEKKADGSVKVKIDASFGTGSGAAAGAGGQ